MERSGKIGGNDLAELQQSWLGDVSLTNAIHLKIYDGAV